MSKVKRLVILTSVSFITILTVFGLIVPNILKSREPEMKQFLTDMGYKDAKMTSVSGWRYQVTFETNKGSVNVLTIKNGGFAIKY